MSTLIRGVRVNLAAAICWENYMPLLRQALYAQNINLYLAPTADGRDAWLGLMRTVGVEGRCFVVSSNMCVRRDDATTDPHTSSSPAAINTAATATTTTIEEEEDSNSNNQRGGDHVPRGANGARRNSAITEDGFEIALPRTTAVASADAGKPQRRRKSVVLDEDGNEIVLHCCDDDEISGYSNKPAASETTSTSHGKTATAAAAAAAAKGTNKFISRGGSCITNPFGDVLAGPSWEDDEEIIYADVDFKDCIRARLDSDAAGSYSR